MSDTKPEMPSEDVVMNIFDQMFAMMQAKDAEIDALKQRIASLEAAQCGLTVTVGATAEMGGVHGG